MMSRLQLSSLASKTHFKANKTTKKQTQTKKYFMTVKVANLIWLMFGNALPVKSGCTRQIFAQDAIGHYT
jgi:hypothetical protein